MKPIKRPKDKIILSIVNALMIVAIFTFVVTASSLLPMWGELLAHGILFMLTAGYIYNDFKGDW